MLKTKCNYENRNSYDLKRELMELFMDLETVNEMEDGEKKDLMLRQLDDKCRGMANYFTRPANEIATKLSYQDKKWYDRMERYAKEDRVMAERLETYKTVTAQLGYVFMF